MTADLLVPDVFLLPVSSGPLVMDLAVGGKALLVAVAIGLDLFAAGMAVGATRPSRRRRLGTAGLYAGLGVLFPLFGLALGRVVQGEFGVVANLGAVIVLIGLGIGTVRTNLGQRSRADRGSRPVRLPGTDPVPGPGGLDLVSPAGLAISGVAVSLDAFAVGFSLPLLRIPLVFSLVLIGLVGFGLTVIGLRLGSLIGTRMGEQAELLSGLCLALTGLLLLAEVAP